MGGGHAHGSRPAGVRVRLLLHRVLRRGGHPGRAEPHRDAGPAGHGPAGAVDPAPGAAPVRAPGDRRPRHRRAGLPRAHQDRDWAGGEHRRGGAVRRWARALRRARHRRRPADGLRALDRRGPGPLRRRRSEVALAGAALPGVPLLAVRPAARAQRRPPGDVLGDAELPGLRAAGGAGAVGPALGDPGPAQPGAVPGRRDEQRPRRPAGRGRQGPIGAGRPGPPRRRQARGPGRSGAPGGRVGADHRRVLDVDRRSAPRPAALRRAGGARAGHPGRAAGAVQPQTARRGVGAGGPPRPTDRGGRAGRPAVVPLPGRGAGGGSVPAPPRGAAGVAPSRRGAHRRPGAGAEPAAPPRGRRGGRRYAVSDPVAAADRRAGGAVGQPAPLGGGRAGLRRAHLRRADLGRADLRRADLRRAAQRRRPAQRRGRPAGGAGLLAPAGPVRAGGGGAARGRHPDPGRPGVAAGPPGRRRGPVGPPQAGQRGRGGRGVLGRAAG
ncbi:pentapeptide repeat-containing protein [Micromonospora sp. NPDC051006]|uniref:pentapeptide repeat-containing protein n=1 Tax=Micromonospora sp. NPDC051006 TaxID=3364283 RepID=UPI00379DC4C7